MSVSRETLALPQSDKFLSHLKAQVLHAFPKLFHVKHFAAQGSLLGGLTSGEPILFFVPCPMSRVPCPVQLARQEPRPPVAKMCLLVGRTSGEPILPADLPTPRLADKFGLAGTSPFTLSHLKAQVLRGFPKLFHVKHSAAQGQPFGRSNLW